MKAIKSKIKNQIIAKQTKCKVLQCIKYKTCSSKHNSVIHKFNLPYLKTCNKHICFAHQCMPSFDMLKNIALYLKSLPNGYYKLQQKALKVKTHGSLYSTFRYSPPIRILSELSGFLDRIGMALSCRRQHHCTYAGEFLLTSSVLLAFGFLNNVFNISSSSSCSASKCPFQLKKEIY